MEVEMDMEMEMGNGNERGSWGREIVGEVEYLEYT